jgi:hypothetical protein
MLEERWTAPTADADADGGARARPATIFLSRARRARPKEEQPTCVTRHLTL